MENGKALGTHEEGQFDWSKGKGKGKEKGWLRVLETKPSAVLRTLYAEH